MLVQLRCGVQTYDWGKLGSASAVAQFAAASDPSFKIDESTPYAELWMGTHPKQPSEIIKDGAVTANLRQLIAEYPEVVGTKVAAKFGDKELPYLFKVLSIRKALSIQAHPDKALARQLHARDPKNYPDDNHKPEMTIALTDFEGFCGFRPLPEMASFITHVPEYAALLGDAGTKFVQDVEGAPSGDHREAIRGLVQALMTNNDAAIAKAADALVARAKSEGSKFAGPHGGQELADLTIRLNDQFPQDVGLFSGGLMLNFVRLKKGEAMFLRAKDPHAYISGDIIECMAASDNVVRSGFTPKFKDVPTLVAMLTCESGAVHDQKMKPEAFAQSQGGSAKLFDPPIEEFSVLQQAVPAGSTAKVAPLTGGSIFIVTEGKGKVVSGNVSFPYETGHVFFSSAGSPLEIEAAVETVTYHALCEI